MAKILGKEIDMAAAANTAIAYGATIALLTGVMYLLYMWGVVTPGTVASCGLANGFSCMDFNVTAGGVVFSLNQTTGRAINVTGIACTAADAPVFTPVDVKLENGTKAEFRAPCTDKEGRPPGPPTGFVGRLVVKYVDSETGAEKQESGPLYYPAG